MEDLSEFLISSWKVRLLDRYLTWIFIKAFLSSLAGMTFLFAFQGFFAQIFDNSFTFSQLVYYHLLGVPFMMAQAIPCSVLLATVLSLSHLTRTQELVACMTVGFGFFRLITIFLSVVVMIGSFSLVLQDRILPSFYRKQVTYLWREVRNRQDFFLDIKSDRIWYRSRNMIYNLQRFDHESKMIFGMSIYKFDPQFNLAEVVNADRAAFDGKVWKLLKGTVTEFSSESEFPHVVAFAEREVVIQETPREFQEIEKEVNGLRLKELYHYIQRMKAAGADTKKYEVSWHARLSTAFIAIVMFFLAIPFSLKRSREGGLALDLFLCLGVTFFYWLFYAISLSLGTNGALPPGFAAWLPSIIFVILAATLIARKT